MVKQTCHVGGGFCFDSYALLLYCKLLLIITHQYHATLLLHEMVGFKIKNSIFSSVLHSGTTKWTSIVGWSFGPLGVARGIKVSGTGLTFDPFRLLSDLIRKQKYSSRTNYDII